MENKWKLILLGIIAVIVAFLVIRLFIPKAEATQVQKYYICHVENPDEGGVNQQTLHLPLPGYLAHLFQHDADYSGACVEPEPEVCEDESALNYGKEEECEYPEEEPTPTPEEPKPEEPQGNPPTFAGSSTGAPGVCPINDIGTVANIFVKTTGEKGELEVQWSLPERADQVHIEYGLEQKATHALLNTPNDGSEVIRDLESGKHYWFRVAGVRGCGVGQASGWFDPIVP